MSLPPELVAQYDGQFLSTLSVGENGPQLWITRADPRIRIAEELIHALSVESGELGDFDGSLLKIYGTNRTVIYRVDHYCFERMLYLASWPD